MNKDIIAHIATLKRMQEYLFSAGHNFWFCASMDRDKKVDFYYYQRNRIESMATCTTCIQLIENKRLISKLEKQIQNTSPSTS